MFHPKVAASPGTYMPGFQEPVGTLPARIASVSSGFATCSKPDGSGRGCLRRCDAVPSGWNPTDPRPRHDDTFVAFVSDQVIEGRAHAIPSNSLAMSYLCRLSSRADKTATLRLQTSQVRAPASPEMRRLRTNGVSKKYASQLRSPEAARVTVLS